MILGILANFKPVLTRQVWQGWPATSVNFTVANPVMTCVGTGTLLTPRVRTSKQMKANSRKSSELQDSAWLSQISC